jgi:hypothetical protein
MSAELHGWIYTTSRDTTLACAVTPTVSTRSAYFGAARRPFLGLASGGLAGAIIPIPSFACGGADAAPEVIPRADIRPASRDLHAAPVCFAGRVLVLRLRKHSQLVAAGKELVHEPTSASTHLPPRLPMPSKVNGRDHASA